MQSFNGFYRSPFRSISTWQAVNYFIPHYLIPLCFAIFLAISLSNAPWPVSSDDLMKKIMLKGMLFHPSSRHELKDYWQFSSVFGKSNKVI